MKLNPEALVVVSFDTAGAGGADVTNGAGTDSPVCPTPNTACFVCDPTVHNCA